MHAKLRGAIGFAAQALCAGVIVLSLATPGCSTKPTGRAVPPKGNTSQADEDKIKGYLEAAGIKGDIVTIVPNGEQFIVDVSDPKPGPGRGPTPPRPPITYLVDMPSGKVTASGM